LFSKFVFFSLTLDKGWSSNCQACCKCNGKRLPTNLSENWPEFVFQGKEKNYKVNWRPTKHSSNLNERVATCWSFRNSYFGSNFWHATEQTINSPDWATTPGETYRTCCSLLKYWTFFIAVCSITVCELVFCYSLIIFSDKKKRLWNQRKSICHLMREIFLQDKIYLKGALTSTSTSPDISNPSLTLIPMTRNLLRQFTLYFEA